MWEAEFGVLFRPATNKGRRSIISARKIKVPSRKRTSHRSPISKGGINAGSFTSSPNFGTASCCRVVVVVKLVLAVSLLFIVVASAVVVVFRPFFPSCLRFFLADPRLLRRRGEEEAVEDVVVVLVVLPLPRRYLASSLCRSIYASTPRAVRDGKRAANRSVFCKP